MNEKVLENIEQLQICRKRFMNNDYGSLNLEQFNTRMKERFSDMFEKYPTIFEKTLNGFFDKEEEMKRLRMAMGLIEKTNKGELEKEDGEKQFGQHLVDIYVTPNLPDKGKGAKDKSNK
jgi:hypothetical protein